MEPLPAFRADGLSQRRSSGAFQAEFANGVGFGTIDYDLGGLFELSFGWTGAFTEDGFLGSFGGTVPLPFVGTADVTGRFDAPDQTLTLDLVQTVAFAGLVLFAALVLWTARRAPAATKAPARGA